MNINAKTLTVRKTQNRSLGYALFVPIIAILRWVNRNYNDYDIRAEMGELSPFEAREEERADISNAEWNRLAGEFWTSGG